MLNAGLQGFKAFRHFLLNAKRLFFSFQEMDSTSTSFRAKVVTQRGGFIFYIAK